MITWSFGLRYVLCQIRKKITLIKFEQLRESFWILIVPTCYKSVKNFMKFLRLVVGDGVVLGSVHHVVKEGLSK